MRKAVTPKILYAGTPVVLISTADRDGRPNLAPNSSAWSLGWTVIVGLTTAGKTYDNLLENGECVLNYPSDDLWGAVERLAPPTGKDPVPEDKRAQFRFEGDKFGAADLTPEPSSVVAPPRVAECPLQMEGRLRNIVTIGGEHSGIVAVELSIVKVHADDTIILDGDHIDPVKWRPLIYSFRHYFGLSPELGRNFRSET